MHLIDHQVLERLYDIIFSLWKEVLNLSYEAYLEGYDSIHGKKNDIFFFLGWGTRNFFF